MRTRLTLALALGVVAVMFTAGSARGQLRSIISQADLDAVTNANFAAATNAVLTYGAAGTTNALTPSGPVDITSLFGVGTGDTPQFTGIEVGHATDTTLTRDSAGVIAIEGVPLTGGGAAATDPRITVAYTNHIYNFLWDDSFASITNTIHQAPHIIPGTNSVQFMFGTGTYAFVGSAPITFEGFHSYHTDSIFPAGNPVSAGGLYIRGNTDTSEALNSAPSVHLDFSGASAQPSGEHPSVNITGCFGNTVFHDIKVSRNTPGGGGRTGALNISASLGVYVHSSYFAGDNTSDGANLHISACTGVYLCRNYISNTRDGIWVTGSSSIRSVGNDDHSTQPAYGIRCDGSIVMKDSTQPTGTTADEHAFRGGVIR